MKNRIAILLVLAAAGCRIKNNASLIITKMIPPTATALGSGLAQQLGCTFDPASPEFTPDLAFNPLETRGRIGAVVNNTSATTAAVNPVLRTDASTFLPHQAVVTYEFINAGGATAPSGETIVPTSGIEVPSSSSAVVGVAIFSGVNFTGFPNGGFVRTTMHLEGKLVDGSTVHTSEREYLFQICTTPGCSNGGPWTATVNGGTQSCL